MHTLYFVGHFIGLPTCFDPYGSSSGHLIKSVHLLVIKVIITKMHGATHIKVVKWIIYIIENCVIDDVESVTAMRGSTSSQHRC